MSDWHYHLYDVRVAGLRRVQCIFVGVVVVVVVVYVSVAGRRLIGRPTYQSEREVRASTCVCRKVVGIFYALVAPESSGSATHSV